MSDKGPLLGKRTSGRPRVSPENYRSAGRAQPIGPLPTCVRAILRMRLGQEAFLADNACRLLRGSTPSICIHGFSALGAAHEEAQPPLVTVNEYWPLAMATGLGREPAVTHQAFHAIIREVFVRELLRFAFVADRTDARTERRCPHRTVAHANAIDGFEVGQLTSARLASHALRIITV
jgi:hypothetical protein